MCTRLDDCEDTVDPVLEDSLSVITYLGVALSMAGLAATIVTLSIFKLAIKYYTN